MFVSQGPNPNDAIQSDCCPIGDYGAAGGRIRRSACLIEKSEPDVQCDVEPACGLSTRA